MACCNINASASMYRFRHKQQKYCQPECAHIHTYHIYFWICVDVNAIRCALHKFATNKMGNKKVDVVDSTSQRGAKGMAVMYRERERERGR